MSNNILFIFEGESTEKKIVKSLQTNFLNENLVDNTIIKCSFGTEIYQLYKKLQEDPDLDTFNLVRDISQHNRDLLNNYTRKDFAEIYLFFDYDGQSSLASPIDKVGNIVESGDEKIKKMLVFFNNETDKGKLYLSYPMVEAIKHISDYATFYNVKAKSKGRNCVDFGNCKHSNFCIEGARYKQLVSRECLKGLNNFNKYSNDIWKQLIRAHIYKMNYIVNESYSYPTKSESQYTIFENQLNKYICKECHFVSVLSAFPIFVHDYFGNKKTIELI